MKRNRPIPTFSADEARAAFDYNPETGELRWRKRGGLAGCFTDGYLKVRFRGFQCFGHVLIWFIMTGVYPESIVDHRDRDSTNNRWANFRLANDSQSASNTRPKKTSRTGLKGVSLNPAKKLWRARLYRHGRRVHIGSFRTKEDAARAYDMAALKHHGDHAFLNFPERIHDEPPQPASCRSRRS